MNKFKVKVYFFLVVLSFGCFVIFGNMQKSFAAMVALSTEELTKKAQNIIIGKVIDKASFWNTNKTVIYTQVTIQVNEIIKGSQLSDIIIVRIPGGTVDGISFVVSDTPSFSRDDEVLLFITENQSNPKIQRIVEKAQGKYNIKFDEQTQQKIIEFEGGVRVGKSGKVFMQEGNRIPLSEFIAEIKKIIDNK